MAESAAELYLSDYLQVAKRRKWVILSLALFAVAAAVVVSALQTPQYRAQARVRVTTGASATILADNTNLASNVRSRNLQNEVEFAKGDRVSLRASDDFGEPVSIDVGAAADSDTLTFTAVGVDPDRTALIANTFADAYVSERSLASGERFIAAADVINDRLATISTDRLALENELSSSADPASIQIQIDSLRSEEVRLRAQLNEIDVLSQLNSSASVAILNAADSPRSPFSPSWFRNIGLGAVAGLLLAVGVALVLETLDDTILTKRDLEDATVGLPVLGMIPTPRKARFGKPRENQLVSARSGAFTESFRSLRSAIELGQAAGSEIRSILVTSANAAEGKSTVAAHLAVSFARSGINVLVIDADMHNPTQHELFGIANRNGLADEFSHEGNAEVITEQASGESLLSLIPSGSGDIQPAELLGSEAAYKFIEKLGYTYDLVIIDSPPLRPVADTLPLARIADATLIVAMRGRTNATDLDEAIELLLRAQTRPLGAVLNGVEEVAGGYGYGARRA